MSVKVNQVSVQREELPVRYADLLAANPLLGRIEGACRPLHWTAEEIRTMQLLVACQSNASLQQRLTELERSLATQS